VTGTLYVLSDMVAKRGRQPGTEQPTPGSLGKAA
jgi:hypothetical protein